MEATTFVKGPPDQTDKKSVIFFSKTKGKYGLRLSAAVSFYLQRAKPQNLGFFDAFMLEVKCRFHFLLDRPFQVQEHICKFTPAVKQYMSEL